MPKSGPPSLHGFDGVFGFVHALFPIFFFQTPHLGNTHARAKKKDRHRRRCPAGPPSFTR